MKVGDMVRCTWQPTSGETKHTIKGEVGIITHLGYHFYYVLFPKLGYTHPLVWCALEVISEEQ